MIIETLKKNVYSYFERKIKIEEMEEIQGELKKQNLTFMKMLGKKKGDIIIFDDLNLQIQLIEMRKKERVNEEGLIGMVGKEKVDSLKVLRVAIVEAAINSGLLPDEAEVFIIKKAPVEYTKIMPVGKIGIDQK